jgi:uncharacterized integral membrane protein
MTTTENRPNPTGRRRLPRSPRATAWVILLTAAVVLLLLLVFILQNGQRADVSFLGAHWHLPIGVALLLAAVFGVLLVALPGTARMLQLRLSGRRGHHTTVAAAPTDVEPAHHDAAAS